MAQTPAPLQALRSSVRLTKIQVGVPPHHLVFEVELRFMLREPQSKIARAVTQPTSDAPISFARPPTYFPAIVQHLSDPKARAWAQKFPDEAALLEFLEEAEFYDLVGLAKEIRSRLCDVRRVNVYVGIGRDFLTIGAAVAACGDGQRIIVEPGSYEEHLEITKDVSIIALTDETAPAPPHAAPIAPLVPRAHAGGGKRGGGVSRGVIIQFASDFVVRVSGKLYIENVTIKRIQRTGFERKNVLVDLSEDAVKLDNTVEQSAAAVRVVSGGSLQMQGCCLVSQTDSMLSVESGCSVTALQCDFNKARGNGITCQGRLAMRSCTVTGGTDAAIVVELGSLELIGCSVSLSEGRSCLISRSSNITCSHTTFSACSGPCIRLGCVGTLTSDVFASCVQARAPTSNDLKTDATLPQNGFDPAALSLLLTKFQGMATAVPATSHDMQTLKLRELKHKLIIGEALFKNCTLKDCGSTGIVCCGGSIRLIDVSLQECKRVALLVQDQAKLSISSCRISNCSGSAMWARGRSGVLAVGLKVEGSNTSGIVVDGFASARLVDSSISGSARSGISIMNGAVHLRGVCLDRNAQYGLETCSEETCSLLLKTCFEDLQMFKSVARTDADAIEPAVMALELQSCDITGNGDGIILESKRKLFESEPVFSRVQFVGNLGHGCLLATAACNPVFRNCLFRGNAACGLRLQTNGKGLLSTCKIEKNGSCAVHVQGQGSFCSLRDCDVSGHAVAGLLFEDYAGAEVNECRIVGNSIAVIVMSNAAPVMTRCLLSSCSGTAMVCGQNSLGKYDACIFSDNVGLAVSIESAARPHLVACNFCPALDNVNAITCCSGSEGNITNCTFEGVGSIALALQRDSDVRVAHCCIKGCSQFGILCMPGSKGSLECAAPTPNPCPA